MDQYIASALSVLMIVGVMAMGMEAYDVYAAVTTVRGAISVAELQLASDGGVSPQVIQLVQQQLTSDHVDLSRVQISGTPAGVPWGGQVMLSVDYDHPYKLVQMIPGLKYLTENGNFHIHKTLTTVSAHEP